MIQENHRIIIIFGMAHSGTTIFAKTLAQCPQIHPFINGSEAWIFENNQLGSRTDEDASFIQDALLRLPKDHFIMLKRPWAEIDPVFFKKHMPNASFYCFLKSFLDIKNSWSKPTSFVPKPLKIDPTEQSNQYWLHLRAATNFPVILDTKRYQIIEYGYFVSHPENVFKHVCEDLKIKYQFDISEISPLGDVKTALRRVNTKQQPQSKQSKQIKQNPQNLKKRFTQLARDRAFITPAPISYSANIDVGIVLLFVNTTFPTPYNIIPISTIKFGIKPPQVINKLTIISPHLCVCSKILEKTLFTTKNNLVIADTLNISAKTEKPDCCVILRLSAQHISLTINDCNVKIIKSNIIKKLLDWFTV